MERIRARFVGVELYFDNLPQKNLLLSRLKRHLQAHTVGCFDDGSDCCLVRSLP